MNSRLREGWVLHPFDTGAVCFHPNSSQLLALNSTAAAIWELSGELMTAEDIAKALAEKFNIEQATALVDVNKQLAELDKLTQDAPIEEPTSNQIPNFAAYAQTPTANECHRYQIGPTCIEVAYTALEIAEAIEPIFSHLHQPDTTMPERQFLALKHKGEYFLTESRKMWTHSDSLGDFASRSRAAFIEAATEQANVGMVIHAAAVAKEDQCILIPGQSGVGKSTLAAALACSGYTFLGDDIVVVTQNTHKLLAFPNTLNLKQGSLVVLEEQYGLQRGFKSGATGLPPIYYLTPPGYDQSVLTQEYEAIAILFPQYVRLQKAAISYLNPYTTLTALLQSNSTIAPAARPHAIPGLLQWLEAMPAYSASYSRLHDAVAMIDNIFKERAG